MPLFKRTTIGARTFDTIFIGYAENSAAYIFMRLDDKFVCEARDATFFKDAFPLEKVGHSENTHMHCEGIG